MMSRKQLSALLLVGLLGIVSACSSPSVTEGQPSPEAAIGSAPSFEINDTVTLTQSTVTWETLAYRLTEFNTIEPGSFDDQARLQHTFEIWELENQYLRVTLLPEYGGRILSIFYKPTGHEELYQNPIGIPYQIGTRIFYYDWLMVYGGIFPTFPEPEHGKTWLLPWDFEIISSTDQEAVVAMTYVDDTENPSAPRQYNLGVTGLEVTFVVSLKAGRAAVDTEVVITNPGAEAVAFEYWTNTTLAPGSDPYDPRTTVGAEIIAPVEMIKIPSYWRAIASQERALGLIDVYEFDSLRFFENWTDMGIAYAFPDMEEANFWGVINHDNQEGIFRIADNTITPGMKIWTWGYPQTAELDVNNSDTEARPYIELWAGLTREFWQRTEIAPNSTLEFWETYSPSVGLDDVTHANRNFLVNLEMSGPASIECQIFGLYPDQEVVVVLFLDDEEIYRAPLTLDPQTGNQITAGLPDAPEDGILVAVIEDRQGVILFSGSITLSALGQD